MADETDITTSHCSAGKDYIGWLIGVGKGVGDDCCAPVIGIVTDVEVVIFEPTVVVSVLPG